MTGCGLRNAHLLLCCSQASQQMIVLGPFIRAHHAPVITPSRKSVFIDPLSGVPVRWESLHTFNPAAVVRDARFADCTELKMILGR